MYLIILDLPMFGKSKGDMYYRLPSANFGCHCAICGILNKCEVPLDFGTEVSKVD